MQENRQEKKKGRESIFLNEYFMTAACIFAFAAGCVSFVLIRIDGDSFSMFELIVKLAATIAMFFAFRKYDWDVVKGMMGGVLFSLMYQEAHLVLAQLWGQEDFDTYLVAGIQGSIYLSAAGMSFLMTIIITINHFIINYAKKGNPENIIFNRMAIVFKFIVYGVLLVANCMLAFAPVVLWKNAMGCLTDIAVLLLLVCIESQLDSFKVLRQEFLAEKKQRRNR